MMSIWKAAYFWTLVDWYGNISVGNITRWTVCSSSGFGSQLEGNYNTAGGGSVSAEYRFDGNITNNLVTSVTTDGKIR